eukprot:351626-Chlamydomonas_euryale.AAC.1
MFNAVISGIGYGAYTCNLSLSLVDSCSRPVDYPGVACSLLSPSPPPSPQPSPPAPTQLLPSFVDFPHACYPGNSRLNYGIGNGTQLVGFAWNVSVTSPTSNTIRFVVSPNAGCQSITGPANCCASSLDKLEFAINSSCRGAIASVSTAPGEVVRPRSASYVQQHWPLTTPEEWINRGSPLVARLTGLSAGLSTVSEFTLHLRGECADAATFLAYDGEVRPPTFQPDLWFALYGSTTSGDDYGCCGADLRLV